MSNLKTIPDVLTAIRDTLYFGGKTTNGKEGVINCLCMNDLFLANGHIKKDIHRQVQKVYEGYLKTIHYKN